MSVSDTLYWPLLKKYHKLKANRDRLYKIAKRCIPFIATHEVIELRRTVDATTRLKDIEDHGDGKDCL